MLWANRLRTPNNISPLTGVGKGIEPRESKGHQTVLKNVTDEMDEEKDEAKEEEDEGWCWHSCS